MSEMDVTQGSDTTAAPETTTVDASSEIQTDRTIVDTPQAPIVPAYTPNYKYKVHDQEKEFDKLLHPLVKDANVEKHIRDLYTKGEGIELIKQDRETIATERQTLLQERAETEKFVQQMNWHTKNDDMQSVLEMLNIPREKMLKWALREAEHSQNPQARQQYEQQRRAMTDSYTKDQYTENMRSQYESMAVSLREEQLDIAISRAENSSFAESFDARVGQPGAFRDEIIARGKYHAAVNGVDKKPAELIQELKKLYGGGEQSSQQTTPGAAGQAVVAGSKGKPVLPNIPGSGQAPVSRKPRSLDEIKALTAQKIAAEGSRI